MAWLGVAGIGAATCRGPCNFRRRDAIQHVIDAVPERGYSLVRSVERDGGLSEVIPALSVQAWACACARCASGDTYVGRSFRVIA